VSSRKITKNTIQVNSWRHHCRESSRGSTQKSAPSGSLFVSRSPCRLLYPTLAIPLYYDFQPGRR